MKRDKSLWSWGRNDYGQIGDGTTFQRNSTISIACQAPLPVEFINLSIITKINRNYNSLIWQTANEVDVANYEIQVSFNGSEFITIGNVLPKSSTQNQYEYNHFLTDELKTKTLYYRIKCIEINGNYTFSKIILATVNNNLQSILTNAYYSNNFFFIEGNVFINQIDILDMFGRKIKIVHPNTSVIKIDAYNWAKGVYWVVTSDKNGKTQTNKIIIP